MGYARRAGGVTASLVLAVVLAQVCLAADCVDGVTPDCSDAAAQCGPSIDGAARDGAATDAASDATDATAADAAADVTDAATDADLDADADDQ